MKKISSFLLILVFTALSVLSVVALAPETAFADHNPTHSAQGGANSAGAGTGPEFEETIQVITNILVFVVGIAAVIMIIIGAIRYTTSNGDQSQITAAKNTIIYSIVGMILAIMAGAIVNFVLEQF